MFHHTPDGCEPCPRALARLMRCALEPCGPLFGDDVGVEAVDADEPSPVGAPMDETAVRVPDKPTIPTASELKQWLVRTLGANRGVLAAWPEVAGLSQRPSERVLALGQRAAAGHAWWWLWHLKRTGFSRKDSYRAQPHETVYRLGGEPSSGFDWIPGGATYGVDAGVAPRVLYFGLAATVRELTHAPREPSFEKQVEQAAAACYMQLDAATHGIAPIVFATMLATDADDYRAVASYVLPADAAVPNTAVTDAASRRVEAIVTVSQLHTCRLEDMLRAHAAMGAEENVGLARKEIQGACVAVAAKIKQLADLKVLKLSMAPRTVVFCPELVEVDDAEDWELRGFGFRTRDFDVPQGKPFLVDYDARLCKRLMGQEGYDAGMAFVLMVLVLLEAVRAQFPSAHPLVLEAMRTTPFEAAFAKAAEKVDSGGFVGLLSRAFEHARVERAALPKLTMAEMTQDFAHALRGGTSGLARLAGGETGRPAFHKLVMHLLGTRSYVLAEPFTDEELAAEHTTRKKEVARLDAVVSQRHARLLARKRAAVRA